MRTPTFRRAALALALASVSMASQAGLFSNLPNIPYTEATSPLGAVVNFSLPTYSDPGFTVTSNLASGSIFALGLTNLVFTATDSIGNSDSTSLTVTVGDFTPPVIHGTPADIFVTATSPLGAVVFYSTPTATDIVDLTVPVSGVKPSGSLFAIGTNTVVFTARDSSGNTASTFFNITVNEQASSVPEPGSLALGLAAFGALGLARRRAAGRG